MNTSANIGNDGDTALAANALCQKCGICCDGSLFSSVTVYKHKIKKLEKAGVKVYGRTRGSFQFDQPGSCFEGGTCSIYAARPEKCRSSFCILQRKVMNGSVSFSDGSKLVIAVKTHAAWLTGRASQMSKKEEKNFQLRDFLVNYYKRGLERNFKGGTLARPPAKLSASDKEFIGRACEYLKLMERFFLETSLLEKYGALIQSFRED